MDENQHEGYGWDEERFREHFIMEKLQGGTHRKIVFIRFNPHEYRNKDKEDERAALPHEFMDSYTTLPSRDERFANIRNLIIWGLGLQWPQEVNPYIVNKNMRTVQAELRRIGVNPRMVIPAGGRWGSSGGPNSQITVVFAYYDKWYVEGSNTGSNIHVHQYDSLEHFHKQVIDSEGLNIHLQNRKIFLNPLFWNPISSPVIFDGERVENILDPLGLMGVIVSNKYVE